MKCTDTCRITVQHLYTIQRIPLVSTVKTKYIAFIYTYNVAVRYVFAVHLPSNPISASDGLQTSHLILRSIQFKEVCFLQRQNSSCGSLVYHRHIPFCWVQLYQNCTQKSKNNDLRQIAIASNNMSFEIKTNDFAQNTIAHLKLLQLSKNKLAAQRHCTGQSVTDTWEIHRPLSFYIVYIKQSRFTGI